MKAAVIGAGHIAHEHLKALAGVPDVAVAICDRSPAVAECAAERFGLNHWFTGAHVMLDLPAGATAVGNLARVVQSDVRSERDEDVTQGQT